jgi:hypothetical protein
MSPATPAFAGTLSLTGANTGGFHLSGSTSGSNILQNAAAGGTAVGTYTDVTASAAQSGMTTRTQPLTLTGAATAVACSTTNPGSDLPYSSGARTDVAAAGYTKEVFCDNFTSLSTINLTTNAPPYSAGYNWYVTGGWPHLSGCTWFTNNADVQQAWCRMSAQNLSGFASIIAGKVNIFKNVSNASFGSGADAVPVLTSCYQTASPPYWAGFAPSGGFYFETKTNSAQTSLPLLWTMSADYFTAGDTTPVGWIEIDNPDDGGYGRGANVGWYSPGNAAKPPPGAGQVEVANGGTSVLGMLAVAKVDNTGQNGWGAGIPFINWYRDNTTQLTGAGTGGGPWPSGSSKADQLTGGGPYPEHNCILISANGGAGGAPTIIDWIRIWTK